MIRKRQVGALHAQLCKRWARNERVSVRAARCALVRKVKTGGLYVRVPQQLRLTCAMAVASWAAFPRGTMSNGSECEGADEIFVGNPVAPAAEFMQSGIARATIETGCQAWKAIFGDRNPQQYCKRCSSAAPLAFACATHPEPDAKCHPRRAMRRAERRKVSRRLGPAGQPVVLPSVLTSHTGCQHQLIRHQPW